MRKLNKPGKVIAVCLTLLCQACQTMPYTMSKGPVEITIPAANISKQHNLSKTADGKLIASWVESQGKDNAVRFAYYDKEGWQPVRTITNTPNKLAASPVVLGLSDGSLAAFWMQSVQIENDRYAAEIFWSQSEDDGITWSQPIHPYSDAARIYDAQMSLTPLPEAKVALVWTDSRFVNHDETKNSAQNTSRYQLMAAILEKNLTISKELTLDSDVCSCCRAFTDASGNELMTVYRDHLPGEIRDISAVRWNKNGVAQAAQVHDDHWVINGCPANGPAVSMSREKAGVIWFSAGDGQGKVKFSFAEHGGAFRAPVLIDDHASGYANTTLLDDGSAMVSWRSNAGLEEKLMTARIMPDGRMQSQTLIASGGFPRWPSNYVAVQNAGDNVYFAWTDSAKKKVRLFSLKPT